YDFEGVPQYRNFSVLITRIYQDKTVWAYVYYYYVRQLPTYLRRHMGSAEHIARRRSLHVALRQASVIPLIGLNSPYLSVLLITCLESDLILCAITLITLPGNIIIRKLNGHTISGVHAFGCKVYPPRDATDAGAPERDGGQLAADSICVASACAGTPGENPRYPTTINTCQIATTRPLQEPPHHSTMKRIFNKFRETSEMVMHVIKDSQIIAWPHCKDVSTIAPSVVGTGECNE
ncbi:hypothetical protein HW555_002025, partial [Spodoptera exigua]